MSKQKYISNRIPAWRIGISLVLLAAACFLLLRQWHFVASSLHAARSANLFWLAAALSLSLLTYCIAALIYSLLALCPLHYLHTLLVELAASFANRLLPAGLGGLGLHGLYLYHQKHNTAQATAVVSVNNLVGITAHLSLLALLIIFRPEVLQKLTTHYPAVHWQYFAVTLLIAVALMLSAKTRHLVINFVNNLTMSLRRLRPTRIQSAFGAALLLTITYTLILVCVSRALGLHLGILRLFIIFSIGMLAGTATPTPGGLVGMEAGLYAGFVSYNVSPANAGAAVLLYRLITYWLPLIPGAISLMVARDRRIL